MEADMRKLVGAAVAIAIAAAGIAFWTKSTVLATGPNGGPADTRISPIDVMTSSTPLPVMEIEDLN
jgi:hypothetical protein